MTAELSAKVLEVYVYGNPAPQGSKRAFAVRGKGGVPTGRVAVIESSHDRVKSWRQAIVEAVNSIGVPALTGPVGLKVTFYLKRPASHYGSGRNAGRIRPGAAARPASQPDLSKLIRATEDALTAVGAWKDDAQVVEITAAKCYDDHHAPGAWITVTTITDTTQATPETPETR